MDKNKLKKLLEDVREGRVTPDEAALELKTEPFEDLGYAKVDTHRGIRQGIPEVIYGAGKTSEQIKGIAEVLLKNGSGVIITRINGETAEEMKGFEEFRYYSAARLGYIGEPGTIPGRGNIIVAAGGTTDLPVAEEAALTAEFLGNRITRLYDVGVSGIHRTLAHMEEIMEARVIIAVAGMEGALPSVIGGLSDCPVIAVPTSVGYGASFGGLAALLAMLNSCASGVSTVNIDNGFGAGYLASMINQMEGIK